MILQDVQNNITVDLDYDEDGYPLIQVNSERPMLAVKLDGIFIHGNEQPAGKHLYSLTDDNQGIDVHVYDNALVEISFGGNFASEHNRPAAEVKVNDVLIHDMFDHEDEDTRWSD